MRSFSLSCWEWRFSVAPERVAANALAATDMTGTSHEFPMLPVASMLEYAHLAQASFNHCSAIEMTGN